MIYTISEWLATISESLIIFFFLVKILSYTPERAACPRSRAP